MNNMGSLPIDCIMTDGDLSGHVNYIVKYLYGTTIVLPYAYVI